MPMNVQLTDEANAVLDEFVIEANRPKEKGKAASEAIIVHVFADLSPLRQKLILDRYPQLKEIVKTKVK